MGWHRRADAHLSPIWIKAKGELVVEWKPQPWLARAPESPRCPAVGEFASYCSCVDTRPLSNAKKKGEANRRNGNPYLAWAFMEAAHFAIRNLPAAQRFYERKRRQRNALLAVKALAHKLARACYYILRDQVPFAPERLFV